MYDDLAYEIPMLDIFIGVSPGCSHYSCNVKKSCTIRWSMYHTALMCLKYNCNCLSALDGTKIVVSLVFTANVQNAPDTPDPKCVYIHEIGVLKAYSDVLYLYLKQSPLENKSI